eukprot:11859740-Heterocapsa_arctica.AAC.1
MCRSGARVGAHPHEFAHCPGHLTHGLVDRVLRQVAVLHVVVLGLLLLRDVGLVLVQAVVVLIAVLLAVLH